MIKSYSSSLRARSFRDKVLEELDVKEPEEALRLLRRMKKVLVKLQEEREKLGRLGLEDVDEALEVMRGMKQRMEELQHRLDGYREAQEKLHSIQDALDVDATDEETLETIRNISGELETLYEEREVLSRAGVSDATEAVQLIQLMRSQLDEVYREMDEGEVEAPGTTRGESAESDLESVVEFVRDVDNQTKDEQNAGSPAGPAQNTVSSPRPIVVKTLERQVLAAQRRQVDVAADEIAPLLSKETLPSLNDHSEESLQSLDVGIIALDEDNTIKRVTTHGPLLPDLDEDAIGSSLFSELPAARNPLLETPIEHAQRTGRIDVRFVYTFPRKTRRSPLPLRLHLHRSSKGTPLWILYDEVE